MIEIITPSTEQAWLALRVHNINSTEISALFGISDYCTPYELYFRKKDKLNVKIEPNERMESGTHYQDAIAQWFAKKNGWTLRRKDEYIQDTELRLAASFDYENEQGELLEIKSVDGIQFNRNFSIKEDGSIECPLQIEAQCQQELLLSGASVLWLCLCVGGNTHYQIKRVPDQRVHDAIKSKVAEFWASIDADTPPEPNFETDAEFIKSLYNYSEPGTTLDVSSDSYIKLLAEEYRQLGEAVKVADTRRDAIKAELLTKIGTAELTIGEGFKISTNMVGPAHIEYERAPYRGFKITWKKEK